MATNQYCCIKEALVASRITQGLTNFNITTVLQYFIESHSDYKDIRQASYQMYDKGHVQDIQILENMLAKKTLIKATCIAHMKQTKYALLMIILQNGDIDHANCTCPAGGGPRGTCKHLAALCYAIEDFVKRFIKEEDRESRTQRLQEWNKPRLLHLPPTPTYGINFEKKKFGKPSRPMCGQHPATYELTPVCDTEKYAAMTFLDNLKQYQTEHEVPVGLLQVVNTATPIAVIATHEPTVDTYIREVNTLIGDVKQSNLTDDAKSERCMQIVTPDPETRQKIVDETREQANCTGWHDIRKGRITGSVCDRVISFTGKVSSTKLVSQLFDPPFFSNAATRYGIQNEPVAIACYVATKRSEGDVSLTVDATGFHTDVYRGYLGASPDGIVSCGDGSRGILEIKCPVKWTNTTPAKAMGDRGYPLTAVSEFDQQGKLHIKFKLKRTNKWYHQIQLSLYCCRDFAQFLDFGMERIVLQDAWVQLNVPKMDNFFLKHIVPKLLV